ncbi:MAG: hypothetical protein HQK50_05875 [Oligoflexia bacterium]|nr:hypothetical protein [Oligoflexia bacterium]MBF0365079.1 hypothetical protein [Oligoflexia bacterium]
MDLEALNSIVREFSGESHGSSNYDEDQFFVRGEAVNNFAPFSYIKKKLVPPATPLEDYRDLLAHGMVVVSYDFIEDNHFRDWYEKQFGKKLTPKAARKILLIYKPNQKSIFASLEAVNRSFEVLRAEKILINTKNLATQLGEWYCKCVFGLSQIKSTSQRGFDFELNSKRIEVKTYWGDKSSPKGVKLRKSLVELSDNCILIYLTNNFMIREICFLDSDFILRKFSEKGHTIFLKDSDLSAYFFSRSSKQFEKVVNKNALMAFASPALAIKLEGRL